MQLETFEPNAEEAYREALLTWATQITEVEKRTWSDLQETTEKGAEGMAALLVTRYTPYKIIHRAAKGTGIDYWLGHQDALLPFQDAARLEVSGILKGTRTQLKSRTLMKIKQTEQSDDTDLPVYVVVMEFGQPRATLQERV